MERMMERDEQGGDESEKEKEELLGRVRLEVELNM